MPSLLCLHFTVSLVAVFFVVAVTCFVVCLNMLWHFAEMCVKGFKPLKSTSLSVCVFFSFSITLVCSFPDVRMDTSALDAYRLSHCGCTCPILSKVCSNDMSSWQQRHSCHWITSVDSCCPPHPPHSPTPTRSLPLSPPLPPSQVNTHWAVHYTMHTMVSSKGNTLLLLSVDVLLF